MGGKYGTEELNSVVTAVVTVEATALKIRDVVKKGGLGQYLKIGSYLIGLVSPVVAIIKTNFAEFKNEVTDLDDQDVQSVVAAAQAAMAAQGQDPSVLVDVTSLLQIAARAFDMAKEVEALITSGYQAVVAFIQKYFNAKA